MQVPQQNMFLLTKRKVGEESSWSLLCLMFSLVTQSCPTLCDPMDCSTPSLPVHHQLPEFTQTHVHWVSDAIQPSYPLPSPSPPAFILSQHQGLFQWVSSLHQVAKVLEFQCLLLGCWICYYSSSPQREIFFDCLMGFLKKNLHKRVQSSISAPHPPPPSSIFLTSTTSTSTIQQSC